MDLKEISELFIPAVEADMQFVLSQTNLPGLEDLYAMLAYHMGWQGEGAGAEARGKRIRPLLVCLCAASAHGEWRVALPAASAVELIHNFSLIHDDIEDNSPLRRGRPTLWRKWNLPIALNAGDALFSLAHLSILRLAQTLPPETAIKAADLLQKTCLHLTQGQHLDIGYQTREDLGPKDYWPMIAGKTAALLAACCELGALTAASPHADQYRDFGEALGLAFQVQDDLLGIWGDTATIGKSIESDLLEKKKSLPVLFGLHRKGEFARRWASGPILPEDVPALAALLESEGARSEAQKEADRLTQHALTTLRSAQPQGDCGAALQQLALNLLYRNK